MIFRNYVFCFTNTMIIFLVILANNEWYNGILSPIITFLLTHTMIICGCVRCEGAMTAVSFILRLCSIIRDKFLLPAPLSAQSVARYKYFEARASTHSVCGESRHHEVLGGFIFVENGSFCIHFSTISVIFSQLIWSFFPCFYISLLSTYVFILIVAEKLLCSKSQVINICVQVVLSAFVAASQAAPQLVYPYGLGYSHAITHAVPTTVKKVNTILLSPFGNV